MTKRKEINAYLKNTRIYLSTVSSLMGKLSLLDLFEFDTVIIDEASQILEPNLCGLFTKFKRFVLIGDHKQLPAVVVQKPLESKINDTSLHELQITDARNSLLKDCYCKPGKRLVSLLGCVEPAGSDAPTDHGLCQQPILRRKAEGHTWFRQIICTAISSA